MQQKHNKKILHCVIEDLEQQSVYTSNVAYDARTFSSHTPHLVVTWGDTSTSNCNRDPSQSPANEIVGSEIWIQLRGSKIESNF